MVWLMAWNPNQTCIPVWDFLLDLLPSGHLIEWPSDAAATSMAFSGKGV